MTSSELVKKNSFPKTEKPQTRRRYVQMMTLIDCHAGVPWWLSRLRTWHCHCCGGGLISGLGTCACHGCGQKKKGLSSQRPKELLKLNSQEVNDPTKNGQKTCVNISPKEIRRRQTNIGKDAQHPMSLEIMN